jgi:hypothetical protein
MSHYHRRPLSRPRVVEPPAAADTRGATPERIRHAQGFIERGNLGKGRTGIVTMRDAPIERALARKIVSEAQYTAAVKYRHHWYRAGLASPFSTVELNRIFAADLTSFSGMAKTEAQVFHRQRYREAVQHIGIIGAAVVEQVVCQEISLEQAGYKLGWGSKPQAIAAATERMKAALDRLVELWGVG